MYAPLKNEFSEETIYRAFISICKFNRQTIIDNELLAICSDKPESFTKSDPISEKVRKLKQEGKVYDEHTLERLLTVSGSKNRVNVQYNFDVITQVQSLRNIMEQCVDDTDTTEENKELIRHLELILDTFDYNTYKTSPEVRSIRNYLSSQNTKMRKSISMFLEDNIKLNRKSVNSMNTFLKTITNWGDDESNDNSQSSSYYNLFIFITTYVNYMVNVFPNMILNNVNYDDAKEQSEINSETPLAKRLNLSNFTVGKINANLYAYYQKLEIFYNEKSISNVLHSISNKCSFIMKMMKHTPYFSEIHSGDDTIVSILDKNTCRMLYEYYFLSILDSYKNLSDDQYMLNVDADNMSYTVDDLQKREESDIPMIDPNVYISDMNKMQASTANLLYQYINIMQNHKDMIQLSYFDIVDSNFKIREGEKEIITTKLERMSDEERELDTIKKINKLGIWNKGLQKGLVSYVKETYDEEREFAERMQEIERSIYKNKNNVSEQNYEQHKDDYLDELERTENENDEYNISNYKGDDENGDYEGMEEEDWESYD